MSQVFYSIFLFFSNLRKITIPFVKMERRRPLQAADRGPLAAADLGLTATFAAGFAAAFEARCLQRLGGENLANRLPCFVPRKAETENFLEQLLIDFVSVRFVCLPIDPAGDDLLQKLDALF